MINRKLWLLFLLLSLVSIFDSYSQIFTDFINTEYINADNGLSQSEVTSIIKDKKGFIWIGTRGGLNRYDGNTIKVFRNKIENSNSLINNSIETTLFWVCRGSKCENWNTLHKQEPVLDPATGRSGQRARS